MKFKSTYLNTELFNLFIWKRIFVFLRTKKKILLFSNPQELEKMYETEKMLTELGTIFANYHVKSMMLELYFSKHKNLKIQNACAKSAHFFCAKLKLMWGNEK